MKIKSLIKKVLLSDVALWLTFAAMMIAMIVETIMLSLSYTQQDQMAQTIIDLNAEVYWLQEDIQTLNARYEAFESLESSRIKVGNYLQEVDHWTSVVKEKYNLAN